MAEISELIGKTMVSVENQKNERIIFTTDAGERYALWHSQDCCESVMVEDIAGDLDDLVGSPIIKAAEVVSDKDPLGYTSASSYRESFTWTFYHLATIKGYVTIRWLGESNGYYSESVDFTKGRSHVQP